MSLYEQNLIALREKNILLETTMRNIVDLASYEVYMDPENQASLNLVHTKTYKPLYQENAIHFVANQQKIFEAYDEYPYLYFFGVGNGMLVKQLLKNPRHQRIVVVEPDMEILYVVLNLIDFSSEIALGRLVLIDVREVDFPSISMLLNTLKTQRYARVYDLHVIAPYYEQFSEEILLTNKIFTETFYHMAVIPGNDTKDALVGLKHHISNLPKVLKSFSLHSLVFRNDFPNTAVLVSMGPSLSKQLPLLKKIAPYVTIVAVDASLPILAKHGIHPDIVTSIERVPESCRFFEQTPQSVLEKIVCVASSVQHEKVLQSIEKSQVVVSLRPLPYMMLTGPKDWGYIGIGMSSANMAYELIYHSHFKTCILIGQDLAYGEDGSSHADGHVFGTQEVQYKESDSWVEAYGGGKKVRTTLVWNMFRGFFEKNISEAKIAMQTINATEGGARIYGALELSFEEAIKTYVQHKRKKTLVLKKLPVDKTEQLANETHICLESIESYALDRQKEVESTFLEVAKICERFEAYQAIENNEIITILSKIQTIRNYAEDEIYQKVIWHIAQSMLFVQELSLATIEVRYIGSEEELYNKRRDLVLAYKGWLFCLAGCIDAILKTLSYARGRSLIHNVNTISVYCEDKQIDTITCKSMSAEKGRVFDVDIRGILYDVPDEYLGRKVVFKDTKTGATLPEVFVCLIERIDEQYNKLRFIASLEEPIDEERLRDLYCPNTIGFLATEENLGDEAFMGYLQTIQNIYPDYMLRGFYFTSRERDKAVNLLPKVELISAPDIYEIICKIEIFIFHQNDYKEYLRFIINVGGWNDLTHRIYFVPEWFRSNFIVSDFNDGRDLYNFRYVGHDYTEEEIKEAQENNAYLYFRKLLKLANAHLIDIQGNSVVSQWYYYKRIPLIMQSPDVKKFLNLSFKQYIHKGVL